MTVIYKLNKDEGYANCVYPEPSDDEKITNIVLEQIKSSADILALHFPGGKENLYKIWSTRYGHMLDEIGECSGNFQTLITYCTEKLGKPPKIILMS